MPRNYYLLKSEPEEYAWEDLVREKTGRWDGVRNFQARNYLRQMQVGDWGLFYHSGKAREVVGVLEVVKEHYPDATAPEGDFCVVDVRPLFPLSEPVSLSRIKGDERLSGMVLVRQARLSVQPVRPSEFRRILALAKTKPPSGHEGP